MNRHKQATAAGYFRGKSAPLFIFPKCIRAPHPWSYFTTWPYMTCKDGHECLESLCLSGGFLQAE